MRIFVFRYILITVVAFICASIACAQDTHGISVISFKEDPTDLTAQRKKIKDQNGISCALIRVQTTMKGFSFEFGSSLTWKEKDEDHIGEIWLWVPKGVKKISIRHPKLNPLLNYPIPVTIKSAKTYIMQLKHEDIEDIIRDGEKRTIIFEGLPDNQILTMTGNMIYTIKRNEKQKDTHVTYYGHITYSIEESVEYERKEGTFEIAKNDTIVYVTIDGLVQKTGTLQLAVNPSIADTADIYIDNVFKGKSNTISLLPLPIGNHTIKVSTPGYEEIERNFSIAKGQLTIEEFHLNRKPNCRIETFPTANINIDGVRTHNNITEAETSLRLGTHTIMAEAFGYKPKTQKIDITSYNTKKTIQFRLKRKVIKSKDTEWRDTKETYLEANYRTGSFAAVGMTVGWIRDNINIEAAGYYGLSKSGTIYWNKNNSGASSTEARYSPKINALAKVGYSLPVKRFRFTPQIGVVVLTIEGDFADGAYAVSGLISARASLALGNRVALSITPEKDFAIAKSEGFKVVSGLLKDIKKWAGGSCMKFGFSLIF